MARPEGQSHLCEAGPARLSASPPRQAPVCTALDTGASTGSQAGLPLTHESKGRGELTCPSAPREAAATPRALRFPAFQGMKFTRPFILKENIRATLKIISLSKVMPCRSTWVAQLIECLTLDFGSGHDPRVIRSSPASGSVLSVEPAWDSFSPSPSLCPTCSLQLKNNKIKNNALPIRFIFLVRKPTQI